MTSPLTLELNRNFPETALEQHCNRTASSHWLFQWTKHRVTYNPSSGDVTSWSGNYPQPALKCVECTKKHKREASALNRLRFGVAMATTVGRALNPIENRRTDSTETSINCATIESTRRIKSKLQRCFVLPHHVTLCYSITRTVYYRSRHRRRRSIFLWEPTLTF